MSAAVQRSSRWLDLRNPLEIAAYERAFYVGFERAAHNRLVRWLWDWDHEARRLRTRIPYDRQRIWVTWSADGKIVAAIAVNDQVETLQSAAYGFGVPPDLEGEARAGRVCEFLTLFIVHEHTMAEKVRLWREIFEQLRSAHFSHALATTSPKIYPLYRWAGAVLADRATIEGEERFFLRFNLNALPR